MRSASSTSAPSSPCEPAGAVATAAWLAGKIEAENPVILVSGGNVARQTAAAILARR